MDRPCPSLVSKLPVLAVSQSGFNAPVFESGLHKSPHFKATWRSTENRVKSGHSLSEFEKVVLGHIRVKGFWLFTWREPQKLARIQKTDIYGKGEENPGIRQQSGSSQCSRENAQQILPGRHEVQKKNSFQLQINIYTRGQRLRLERGQNTTSKKEGRGQSSQQIQRQTLAKGREADLTEHRRTSQVKSRGEGHLGYRPGGSTSNVTALCQTAGATCYLSILKTVGARQAAGRHWSQAQRRTPHAQES